MCGWARSRPPARRCSECRKGPAYIKIVTLALGYAVLLPNAIAPGNVNPIDDRNGRVIFDVGVTF